MLSDDFRRYMQLQQAVGYKYDTVAYTLRKFVVFAEARGDAFVQAERVVEWAATAASPGRRRTCLLTARRFALAMRAEDNRHEVPPAEAFGRPPFIRHLPHLYSDQEIAQLIAATRKIRKPFVANMYATLFGLLAATGLRISEALALKLEDVTDDGLLIRQTKFRKSRLVPLHDSSQQAVESYIASRRRLSTADTSLFIGDSGKTPCYRAVLEVFDRLANATGLRKAGRQPPRIHDFRHTFAVRSLEQCQNDRQSVSRHMIALGTSLGHAGVTHTYWYLHATSSLMEQIAAAGESLHDGGKP